ncbi:MAG: hypothetical protein IKR25_04535 [Muribaculaceae bacterium]|nr:hypothetical protein [Muribaculaceae bacterium]
MGQTNYLKMLWGILYVVFAGISCWATAESLNLTWPSIPLAVCYGIAIGFYLVASVGATMIANSFNRDKFFQHRGLMLSGGVLIMLFFWIITSLPTNTHTFLFRNKIADVITEEQKTTNSYLMQIQTGQAIDNRIINDTTKLANNVKTQCTALENEIKNELNPGDGVKSREIKKSIADLLGIEKIDNLTGADNSVRGREILARTYRKIIYAHLAVAEKNIENSYRAQSKLRDKYISESKATTKNIDTWIAAWNKGQVSANDPKDVKEDFNDQRLMKGYTLIKTCRNFIDFSNKEDEQRFTANNLESNISHIISVYDLWYEFLFGSYKGSMFMIFCILISLLVDVAAFVFFYLIQK